MEKVSILLHEKEYPKEVKEILDILWNKYEVYDVEITIDSKSIRVKQIGSYPIKIFPESLLIKLDDKIEAYIFEITPIFYGKTIEDAITQCVEFLLRNQLNLINMFLIGEKEK